jgi:nicotinamidase-related amidase
MPHSALLIVDVQNEVMKGAWREAEVLAAIADLAARARAAGTPVIYLQHEEPGSPMAHGASGWEIHPAVAPADGEAVIGKRASDGFYRTTLSAELEKLGVTRLVICGAQTEFCVDATTRAALSAGFDVTLAADAHTTGDGVISAADAIAHHNRTLGWLGHPDHRVTIKPAAEIAFA